MKVLHLVSSPTMTGPADPALGLAKAQRRFLGIDARIAFDRRREGNMMEKALLAGVPIVDGLVLSTKAGPIAALADRSAIRALADEYDLIHAHTSHDHALAAAARGRARLVRTIHHARSARRRGLQGWAYKRTDGFIAIAREHVDLLRASYPFIDPDRIALVHGAVDTDRFRPGLDASALRPACDFLFAIVARIKPGRRHDQLLRAFARAAIPGAHLALIGKGEGEPETRALVTSLGLERTVHFFGFRDEDLPLAISAADATVLLAEGNDAGCRAVLESLACGVPVIGAGWPAIREALEGAECGALIPPDDEAALIEALRALAAADPPARKKMAANARSRACDFYSERIRAERSATFYAKLSVGARV